MNHTVWPILYPSIWKPTLNCVGRKSSFDFVIKPSFDFVSKVIILDDIGPFDNFESKTSVFMVFRSDRKDKPDVRTVIFSEWKSFVLSKDFLRFWLQIYSDFTNDYYGKHIHLLLIHYHEWLTPKWFMQWTLAQKEYTCSVPQEVKSIF